MRKEMKWIPLKTREADEEEKESGYTWMFDCPIPDDGEQTLVTDGKHVWADYWYEDGDGWYFDSGFDFNDVTAWMPFPDVYDPNKEIESEELKIIPINEDESSYDNGELGSLCFKVDEYGFFDGMYFGLKGDGWDKHGEPLVPDWCNYCIPLPWKKINKKINEKCDEIRAKY